jgi:hypothetical protein
MLPRPRPLDAATGDEEGRRRMRAAWTAGPMDTTMTRAEREAFLADVHVGVLSIAEPGRGPLAAPIGYGYEPGGPIWLVTGRDSRKGRLLGPACASRSSPRPRPRPYVSVEGPVTSVAASVGGGHERRLAHRYLGREGGDAYIAATADRRASSASSRSAGSRWTTERRLPERKPAPPARSEPQASEVTTAAGRIRRASRLDRW